MGIITSQINELIHSSLYGRVSDDFRRILAKDFFISHFLYFIYNHKNYRRLIFYGGTCNRVIYDLARISEDIDLDNSAGINLDKLAEDLVNFTKHELKIDGVDVHCQKGELGIARWTVRLPVMKELGLSPLQSEKLHLKIEVSRHHQEKTIKQTPVLRHGRTMVIKHFDEASLFAGKIIACLERTRIKGRDYFDLIWFMQKQIMPNEIKLAKDGKKPYTLKTAMLALARKIKTVRQEDLLIDLKPLFDEPIFVEEWVKNFKELFERYGEFYKIGS